MRYRFRWRRFIRWHSRTVIGNNYIEAQDKMTLYFEDGSIEEIKNWRKCVVKLGPDWAAAQKKSMELQVGSSISTTF